jgi:hypothetical protein
VRSSTLTRVRQCALSSVVLLGATGLAAELAHSAGAATTQSTSAPTAAALGSPVAGDGPVPDLDATNVVRSTWQANNEVAERSNRPGSFTTFIAFEYTSQPKGANLHRNIIFSDSQAPAVPFAAINSINPEDLWDWLDALRAQGIEALAIPHNSNWSEGLMFQRTDWAGKPIDTAYAEQRARNEPLMEITQVKGTSETHPALSPTDEWADFEIWRMSRFVVDTNGVEAQTEGATTGAYARDALRTGLELERTIGVNPYPFGFIGSSDGHDAASPVEEDQYFGKLGVMDGSPEGRGSVPRKPGVESTSIIESTLEWSASGLAGVWAEANTRPSIYAALRRKETFGTSGPRMQVRFFAGYDYPATLIERPDAIARAYAGGVPMGGDLAARADTAPQFFVWAVRDPREAWLQRAQIVKGWLDTAGESHEQVFDVACSDGLPPDPQTHRCADNGSTVNLTDCSYPLDKGAAELKTLWRDPTFDPGQRAFYYARVLQNPTCRWSTWDAVRAGVTPGSKVPATLQERAWSSPIWYAPPA